MEETNYDWVKDVKPGDKMICLPRPGKHKGCGYRPNLEFTVKWVDMYKSSHHGPCIFGALNGDGVYIDSCKPLKTPTTSNTEWYKDLKKGDVVRSIANGNSGRNVGDEFTLLRDFSEENDIAYREGFASRDFKDWELVSKASDSKPVQEKPTEGVWITTTDTHQFIVDVKSNYYSSPELLNEDRELTSGYGYISSSVYTKPTQEQLTKFFKRWDLLGIGKHPDDKPQFEVGSWYLWAPEGLAPITWYLRCSGIDNTRFKYDKTIRVNTGDVTNPSSSYLCEEVGEKIDQSIIDGFLHPAPKTPKKTQFEKGDYIVTLKGKFIGTDCGKKNYCFKVREAYSYLRAVCDLEGSTTNGTTTIRFDKSHSDMTDWRYATEEEKAYYDKIGKPFDVTEMIVDELGNDDEDWYPEPGEYYVEDDKYIGIQYDSGTGKYGQYISSLSGFYYNDHSRCSKTKNRRKATQEEIAWLDACIEADKFILKASSLGDTDPPIEKWTPKREPLQEVFASGANYKVHGDPHSHLRGGVEINIESSQHIMIDTLGSYEQFLNQETEKSEHFPKAEPIDKIEYATITKPKETASTYFPKAKEII